jgi:hypothetical protein
MPEEPIKQIALSDIALPWLRTLALGSECPLLPQQSSLIQTHRLLLQHANVFSPVRVCSGNGKLSNALRLNAWSFLESRKRLR